jgi:adenylate cyclase
MDSISGWSESRAASFKRAVEFAQKALAIDEKYPGGHIVMGNIYLTQRQHEKAITEFKRSISLSPNSPDAHALLAGAMYYSGRFEEALELMKKAMRLGPYYPAFFLLELGRVQKSLGRYEEAIATYNQLRDRCRKGECPSMWWQLGLVYVYVKLGREEEARALVAEALKTNPKLSLEFFKRLPYKDPAHLQRVLETFRKAGLK